MASRAAKAKPARLRLRDVREIFRMIGEVRELGADPDRWRPHMTCRLARLLGAHVVISSEIHFRTTPTPNVLRVVDIGWGCDDEGQTWRIQAEQQEEPKDYWLAAGVVPTRRGDAPPDPDGELVPIKPIRPVYGGTCFILSQYPLPHASAVDQLGIHRAWGDEPFTPAEHRLVRLLHVELGRLWKNDALRRAKDPSDHMAPRLAQTLEELLAGSSEKQIAHKLELSRHTIHNYVKALHQRFGVSSRGELLARAGRADFIPRLSLRVPRNQAREQASEA